MPRAGLHGRSVLVVEDEPIVAIFLQEALTDSGYRVIGPAMRMDDAMALVSTVRPDLAVVDVILDRGPCTELVQALMDLNVPLVLTTGWREQTLPDAFLGHAWLEKPFHTEPLLEILERLACNTHPREETSPSDS